MTDPRPVSLLAALALLAAAPRAQEHGELGRMWTFENPPLAYLQQEYGFQPTPEWLDQVRLSSLRFGQGCSASFVSPKGLIVTNHHCVRGDIAKSQGDEDLLERGFAAASLDDELKLRGLTVQQLVGMKDVTAEVNRGVEPGDGEADVAQKREENQERILADAEREHEGLEAQVVELFQGAVYQLYTYKIYRDVRLVMAPHLQTAHFGGDPDNFTYPRYSIDFSFCRAYEDGKPADTSAHYFRWSKEGPRENDLVFVTGNPGSTDRLLTKAQFEFHRDAQVPRTLQMLDNRVAILKHFSELSPEIEKQLRTTLLSFENGQKAYRGMYRALKDPQFMAHKARAERAFRERVERDPKLRAEYGDLWDDLAAVAAAQTALEGPLNFQTGGGSPHVDRALLVVQAVRAKEEGRKDAEQLAQRAAAQPVPASPIQSAFFADHLERAKGWLPAHDPYLEVALGGRTPREAEAAIRQESRIDDDEYVGTLLQGTSEALEQSDDPAIRIARVLAPRVEANSKAEAELNARAEVLGTKIGRALFAVYGDKVSPDATFTLRFSDGVVKGYEYNGTLAPWRTTMFGLYGRNQEFDNRHPFDLPEIWRERRDRVQLECAVDFVCTVDSTGGNSGSPVIDRERQIVGLLFDGNIESLSGDYIFDDTRARSVCVHVHAIIEAMQKIYDAGRVVDELLGRNGGD
jgi:hypothetical protein